MPEWMVFPVTIYALIAIPSVFIGIVILVSSTDDAEQVSGARVVVAGLFWPVVLAGALVYGVHWVIKTSITGKV